MAIPDELLAFVRDALARGIPRAEAERALLSAGWEPEQVAASLARFADVPFAIPVPRPAPYLSAREAFLYLLLFTTLYLSAYNVGVVIFQFINLLIPDPASTGSYGPESVHRAIRWGISSLIVAFTVFLYLSALTGREVRADPGKRSSRVRRWLTYLTLFIAASIIIGDLISLLNDLLGGDLTLRFALKTVTIGALAAGIFVYYLRDLRDDRTPAAA
jgi:hypothetical protein